MKNLKKVATFFYCLHPEEGSYAISAEALSDAVEYLDQQRGVVVIDIIPVYDTSYDFAENEARPLMLTAAFIHIANP